MLACRRGSVRSSGPANTESGDAGAPRGTGGALGNAPCAAAGTTEGSGGGTDGTAFGAGPEGEKTAARPSGPADGEVDDDVDVERRRREAVQVDAPARKRERARAHAAEVLGLLARLDGEHLGEGRLVEDAELLEHLAGEAVALGDAPLRLHERL